MPDQLELELVRLRELVLVPEELEGDLPLLPRDQPEGAEVDQAAAALVDIPEPAVDLTEVLVVLELRGDRGRAGERESGRGPSEHEAVARRPALHGRAGIGVRDRLERLAERVVLPAGTERARPPGRQVDVAERKFRVARHRRLARRHLPLRATLSQRGKRAARRTTRLALEVEECGALGVEDLVGAQCVSRPEMADVAELKRDRGVLRVPAEEVVGAQRLRRREDGIGPAVHDEQRGTARSEPERALELDELLRDRLGGRSVGLAREETVLPRLEVGGRVRARR